MIINDHIKHDYIWQHLIKIHLIYEKNIMAFNTLYMFYKPISQITLYILKSAKKKL